MNPEEIIKNNRKIAIFMGGVPEMINVHLFNDAPFEIIKLNDTMCEPCNLDYHQDWNKLMEVVEYIEKIGKWFTKITEDFCFILHEDTDKNDINIMGDNKKDATYEAVLEFIEFYNESQNNIK